jgi:nuclear transport factor 2 (NTF2) superfamily protein
MPEIMDVSVWTGETSDSNLALGASEYSLEEAKGIVKLFAEVTTTRNVDDFIQGFTEDCITNFNEFTIIGRENLKTFTANNFSKFPDNFVCQKTLRSLNGNVFGVIWVNNWSDADTGKTYRSKGVEFWVMENSKIKRWDASLVRWEVAD